VTSFSVVRDFAAQAGGLKICHGGTLDPFAHGLLLLLVGHATRLMDLLHPLPKIYVADVIWGQETDNGDPTGRTVATGEARDLNPGRLESSLHDFVGWRDQVPPATSAKKVGGEPAYRKAHRGERVDLPPSRVYLHEARWLTHELPATSRLQLVSRGGYYVRALARDLGRAVGSCAHLVELHRMAIGPWEDPGPEHVVALHGALAVPWARRRQVSREERRALKARQSIRRGDVLPPLWSPPSGFPWGEPPVAALDGEVLFALLRENGEALSSDIWLSPGM
jgi:tRNA pseudouridine55 synthase